MTQEQSHRQKWTGESNPGFASRWLRFRTLEIILQPGWRSWIFFLVVSASALFLGGEALRAAFVSILGESMDAGVLKKAVALDPSNPELHHRLGMVLVDSFGEADRNEGLRQLRHATELNPLAARYWSDLAWVCEMTGDEACAAQGVEQAVKLSPKTPQLHWVAANTLLRAGQSNAALAEFRGLLELDPTYGPAAFHVCLGSLGDPKLILQRVLPPGKDPTLKLAYINFLSTNEENELAYQIWGQVVEAGAPFPLPLAAPYVERLLQAGSYEEAQGAWRDLEKLGVISRPAAGEEDNLVFNGGFELTPLNTGLDWRDQPSPYIALDFSDPSAHSGNRCLRIDFTVSRNEQFLPLYQYVPVAPNQTYLLTAYVRSQDITSDSGPRLQVLDTDHQRDPNVMSESTVGTTPWHQISLKFCTGPDTKIVHLSVIRLRGRTFPTEITGSFWLDTIVMKPLGPGGKNACAPFDR